MGGSIAVDASHLTLGTCLAVCVLLCVCACVSVSECMRMSVCVCVCMSECMRMCVCVCMRVCVYYMDVLFVWLAVLSTVTM